jgi:hypothetical protein
MLDELIEFMLEYSFKIFILAFCLAVIFVSCSMLYTMFYYLKLLFK